MKSLKAGMALFCIIFCLMFLPGCQTQKIVEKNDPQKSDSKNYQKEAFKYLRKGEIDRSLRCFDSAIKADPSDYLAYYNRGTIYLQSKYDINKAIKDIDKSLELNPEYMDSYLIKGDIFKFKKEYEQAQNAYNKAAELEPENPFPYRAKSDFYLDRKKYNLALDEINKAIKIEPTGKDYLNRGRIYCEMKKYNLALNDYEKAFKMKNIKIVKYYTLKGCMYFDKKEYNEAVKNFEESIKIDKKYNDSNYYLGIICQERKQYKKALSLFREYYDKEFLDENNQVVMYFYSEQVTDTKKRIKEIEEILNKKENE